MDNKDKLNKKDIVEKDENEIEVLELWEPHADEITDAKDRHIKMSKQSTNKIVIVLVALGAFLVMWYATFAQPLAFNVRQAEQDGDWNIGFTDMKVVDIVGQAKEVSKHDFTSTKAVFSVSLVAAGDKIVYDLTIKNSGIINAVVDSIYIVPENDPNDTIIYSVDGINVGDKLKAGESTNMKVSILYNSNATVNKTLSKTVSVIINYKES